MGKCKLCEYMKGSYKSLSDIARNMGVYIEFGAVLQVRNMRNGRLRFAVERGIPKIAYCPSCGASMKKRIREWRKNLRGVLNVTTRDGIEIHVLPDAAICRITGKCPLEMDKCPILNFDDTGETCVPELCDEYTED